MLSVILLLSFKSIYSGYKSFIRHILCKYFLWVSGFFYFWVSVEEQNFSFWVSPIYQYFLLCFLFFVFYSWDLGLAKCHTDFSLCFLPEVLALSFRSMTRFNFCISCDIKPIPFYLEMWTSNCFSSICRNCSSLLKLFQYLCWKSVGHMFVGIFLDSLSLNQKSMSN